AVEGGVGQLGRVDEHVEPPEPAPDVGPGGRGSTRNARPSHVDPGPGDASNPAAGPAGAHDRTRNGRPRPGHVAPCGVRASSGVRTVGSIRTAGSGRYTSPPAATNSAAFSSIPNTTASSA